MDAIGLVDVEWVLKVWHIVAVLLGVLKGGCVDSLTSHQRPHVFAAVVRNFEVCCSF